MAERDQLSTVTRTIETESQGDAVCKSVLQILIKSSTTVACIAKHTRSLSYLDLDCPLYIYRFYGFAAAGNRSTVDVDLK